MAFTVSCRTCHKNFKTGSSAKKHHDKSHPGSEFNGGLFKDSRGLPLVSVPAGKQLESAEEFASYKTWLALLTEQITGSLHPNAKGKAYWRLWNKRPFSVQLRRTREQRIRQVPFGRTE